MNIYCRWAQVDQKRIALAIGLLFLLLVPRMGYAQTPSSATSSFSRWSIQGALGNQTIGFPFQNSFGAFNPVLSDVGVIYRINKHPRHTLSVGIANSCLFNESTGNTFIIHLDLGYTYTHAGGVFGSFGLDIGSGFLFQQQEGFSYNAETEVYESTSNRFNVGYSGFQLTLGYDMAPRLGKPFSFFLRNKFGILSPYFPTDLIPILPQNILELGLAFKFKKRSSNAE